ncbi:hypothetical protein [Siminovitchia terrae]|uniref:hypothetical protein n=1 Tax=Siminovitchia terrae TaxID=1914933 RepID=UPI0028A716F5|nr:hypothetical protein [Siminovitchia terrae]
MKFDEYNKMMLALEETGIFANMQSEFRKALDSKYDSIDRSSVSEKEFLTELLSFTFREAFRASSSISLLQGQKLEGGVIPKEDL